MAESQSMTTAEVVAKTLITEHADFLRDTVALVARELMEAEISGEMVPAGARSRQSARRTEMATWTGLGRPGSGRSRRTTWRS